jgi:glycosyltransferase involved in cell wall biosynthesis
LKIDFHSPANAKQFGYGRAYFGIRPRLDEALAASGHELTPNYRGGDFGIYFGVANDDLKKYWERKSVGEYIFTMFEATKFSDILKRNLACFDGYIVPCEWVAQIFRENGFGHKPIYVAPLGIEPEDWPLLERPESEIFRAIWQGTFLNDRKGGLLTLKIWNELNLPNSQLILKCNPLYTDIRAEWDPIPLNQETISRFLRIPIEKVNDIKVISVGRLYDQSEMLDVLRTCDLSIYPSFGEGFGLMPLEHMATGLPVIFSDNTGMSTYANPEYNWPVSCKPRCATFGQEFGFDYMPDEDEIKRAILWAYNNRDQAKELGRKASAWVRETWTYEKTAQRLLEIINEVKFESLEATK